MLEECIPNFTDKELCSMAMSINCRARVCYFVPPTFPVLYFIVLPDLLEIICGN